MLSNVAFNFNLRRYTKVGFASAAAANVGRGGGGGPAGGGDGVVGATTATATATAQKLPDQRTVAGAALRASLDPLNPEVGRCRLTL